MSVLPIDGAILTDSARFTRHAHIIASGESSGIGLDVTGPEARHLFGRPSQGARFRVKNFECIPVPDPDMIQEAYVRLRLRGSARIVLFTDMAIDDLSKSRGVYE